MAGRAELVEQIAALVGRDVLRIADAASGWPALADLVVDGALTPVALFAGPVGLSHRQRDEVERRFQNPGGGRPIIHVAGRRPLLLGLWDRDPLETVDRQLLVSADPFRRVGHTTRFSVFVSLAALRVALDSGWSEERNTTGERIRCFVPSLLPVSYAADRDDAAPAASVIAPAIEGSGLLTASDPELPAASERARRAASRLIRDARFSRRVLTAYAGQCAMCGLGVGLVEGAHIYPAAAPGSHDEPWNGLSLCPNHHLAFDRHVVAVRPGTLEIAFRDTIRRHLSASPSLKAFIDATYPRLAEPANPSARPRKQMFQKRYEYFAGEYEWLRAR